MNQRRCHVSVAVLDGYIYALGGADRRYPNTAERYRPETNQWSLIQPMNVVRSDAGCAAFNKKIYVCGGSTGFDILQCCEYYSPETNQWTRFTNMKTRCWGLGVILYDNRVFALGGWNGYDLRSVEAYDPETDQWNKIPPMLNGRSYFGTAGMNNKLFVMGGCSIHCRTNCVEDYDDKTNTWTRAGKMGTKHWGLCCCTVSSHPSAKQYATSHDSCHE